MKSLVIMALPMPPLAVCQTSTDSIFKSANLHRKEISQ